MSVTAMEVLKLTRELEEKRESSVKQLLAERQEIDEALKALGHPDYQEKPKRRVSAAARKNISEAQKRRWARGSTTTQAEG